MAFQSVTDIYVMEGTPYYLALALASLDVAFEHDSFVKIDSSNPLVVIDSSDPVLGPGVTITGSQSQADVPFLISFDDPTSAALDVLLTLTLYDGGVPTGDTTTVTLHVLDDDNPDRPTDINVDGGTVAEDAAARTVVATLSTVDSTPGDTFTYQLIGTSNFVLGGIGGNEIQVADNAHLDFETQPTEVVQVLTTDALGHSFVKDITLSITDVQPDLDVISGAQIQDVEENNASVQVDLKLSDFNNDQVSITSVSGDTDFFTLVGAPPLNEFADPFSFSLVFNAQDFENPLDAGGNNIYDYTITASDGIHTTSRTFHFIVTNVNESPTAVALTNSLTSIAENSPTVEPIKVADIVVADDALGANDLFLVGADSDFFEIDNGTELFLKPGVTLDFESKSSYSVAVDVDDSAVGTSPDLTSSTYVLQVTDVSPETQTGTTGPETLTGSSDTDMIFGLDGNDTLNGAGGNDILTGGLGKDMLTGGLGADRFDFNLKTESVKGTNHDMIMDFSHVEGDHIDVHDIDAKKGPGNQDFKFIGAQTFHHKAGELHFVKHGAFVTVEGDIDGNGKADFQIEVHNLTSNLHSLAKGDFIL